MKKDIEDKLDKLEKCFGRVCWQGFKEGECPLRRLENEKLFLSTLLIIATGLVIWYSL